ncbi:GNAT family N-acetyltransferase [Streptomyces tsukubensis]|uniref:GNAT family N-acetyltransferase n=1 Tax=Streptomyces tsukubensis TaxID=83656 RepID=A0A1V4A9W7_9ACTN|nr:GNAT family N-acetyltransferase [Streptomyces tsukubensis]OON80622.1 GNAT family N-acetyltransferase [Streptomyces tsukubensis]QFR96282.1 GNAT family N-acetyltransferase [Streptomyces tsukubensis]
MSITVTTWFLEQTSPADLRTVPAPSGDVSITRAEIPSPEFSRFLYASVGQDVRWLDRLDKGYGWWREMLERPGVETWVAYEKGTPAGFVELAAGAEGAVEIVYFGLLPAFRGRRIGGHLLSYATARAWDMALRLPSLPATRRVWVHTCSKDGPHALANYQRRGFTVYETESEQEEETATAGPWPGAGSVPVGA